MLLENPMLVGLIAIVLIILFAWSVFNTSNMIAANYHRFPVWFAWLMIMPFVGLIFMWLVLPFGLPYAIKSSEPNNVAAQKSAKTLFALGLSLVILLTISPILSLLGLFTALAAFVLMILYWVQAIQVRKVLSKKTAQLPAE